MAQCKVKDLKKKGELVSKDLVYIFKKDPRTLQRWRDSGILKGDKISGVYYYQWEDIKALIRKLKKDRDNRFPNRN